MDCALSFSEALTEFTTSFGERARGPEEQLDTFVITTAPNFSHPSLRLAWLRFISMLWPVARKDEENEVNIAICVPEIAEF